MKILKSTDCKGQVLITVAIVLIVLVILVGLAIDSGRSYSVKAKLNAALDAAGIAAARAIGNGIAAANVTATTFFNSNYPTGYMQSTPSFCPPNGVPNIITDPNTGDTAITVWATADMPTMFMRVIGQNTVAVGANTTATRRAVDLAFVVDNTGSLSGSGPNVIARSIDFVNNFQPNFDRLALIKYAFGSELPVPFESSRGFDRTNVINEINAFTFNGFTNCSEGFWMGKHQIDTVNNPASLRVIVFFTDGAPNTFASTFEINGSTAYDSAHVGSIRTSSTSSWGNRGLFKHYKVPPDPSSSGTYGSNIVTRLTSLPQYYYPCDANAIVGGICIDPHTDDYGSPPSGGDCGCNNDPNADPNTDPLDPNVFLVLNPGHPRRPVTQYTTQTNWQFWSRINRISRNLVEEMAQKARQQGAFVYTLGLGYRLTQQTGPDNERGEDILLRMANDQRADTFNPNEPEGVYCYAVDDAALGPCFSQIVQAIIRLTI